MADRLFVTRAWLVSLFVLSVIGILQYFLGWPRPQVIPGNEPYYHATVFLGHHLSVASVFIFPFFASLDLAIGHSLKTPCELSKRFLWMAIGAGALTLFFSYSRMLWLALPIGILILLAIKLPLKRAVAMFAPVIIAAAVLSQCDVVKRRMGDAIGIASREDLWEANIEFFKARPLTGVGWHHNEQLSGHYLMEKYPGQSVFSGHGHNSVIDMLGGTGLIGTIAWCFWCLVVTWIIIKCFYRARHVNFSIGIACAWVVLHLNGLTQANFWEGKVMHQIALAVAWALLWSQENEVNEK